jgi:NADPH:quinone reductase-like Zn-dependent oxidoreductase
VPALTAEQVLRETLEVKDGEWLLIHGAGGVTGGVLVSLANHYGAQVIATASPSKHDRLQDLGAEHVLDYHDRRWPRQVLSLTEEKGVPAAVNAVPGGCSTAIQVVRDGGRLSTITSDPPEEERGIRVETVYVRADGAQLTSLARLLVAGRLPISVAARFPLDQAAEALDIARAGGVGGAIVLAITLVDEP